MFKLEEISFTYENGNNVLSDFNLSLAKGEKVALTGGNGAGKTTLLEIMTGLLKPQKGKVFFEGIERKTEKDFYNLRVKTGYLFQEVDDQLFCPTVREEIAFGLFNLGKTREEIAKITAEILDQVGLSGFDNHITYQLSTGEKRLVALAAILAMEPEALLLDEPTAGLDKSAVERLKLILHNLNKTILIVSHDNSFIKPIINRTIIF
ncbi:MAG: energy-coupling factor ABC transporter ATP-binding protein [Victivallales bacterium]|nr:energy-coupling factor ABC transporter ATP-binding protein [Victivallales bacterium]